MPCRLMKTNMSSDNTISAEILAEDVKGHRGMLILDCRSQSDFTRSHVKGAISIFLPSLMLRRLKSGKLNVGCIIQNNEAKDKFNRQWKTQTIVLYDDKTEPATASPTSVIGLLYKKLKQDGAKVMFLQGGFRNFEENFPEFCDGPESDDDTDKEIMGLCNLKIAEDSAYGTCDSNGDLDSPTSNVPVQVIPHLYLGNAKNSADKDVLKNFGISYILNVTPNVPNKFEEDSAFKYMKIPISDHLSQNLSKFFPEAIAFIDEARGSNQGVLVHCLAGVSRSVTITVAYLMQTKQLTLNDAYDYVKACKPNISPNFNFMGQLLEFQRSLGTRIKCSCGKLKCTCSDLSRLISEDSSQSSM
ncbi:dual specificity protein phosphatase 7-like [Ruditapes philippinarum]|uniref:dual specificity protein phosphatase 7-like n=1 Tax=Ruditapes philippinarum TaxID=129788 RepID=UPI00295B3D98|nr:dual specificity protein phosphatase 7-like [Ruditapes philippinarum]